MSSSSEGGFAPETRPLAWSIPIVTSSSSFFCLSFRILRCPKDRCLTTTPHRDDVERRGASWKVSTTRRCMAPRENSLQWPERGRANYLGGNRSCLGEGQLFANEATCSVCALHQLGQRLPTSLH